MEQSTLGHYEYLNYRLYLDFLGFSTTVLCLFQDPIQDSTLHLIFGDFFFNFYKILDLKRPRLAALEATLSPFIPVRN